MANTETTIPDVMAKFIEGIDALQDAQEAVVNETKLLSAHETDANAHGGKIAALEQAKAVAATTAPKVAGTAAVGQSTKFAREDHVHPAQTSVSGNAGTATKLQTARTIGLSGAVVGTATSFNGTANITIPTTAVDVSKATNILPIARGGTGRTDGIATGVQYTQTATDVSDTTYGTNHVLVQMKRSDGTRLATISVGSKTNDFDQLTIGISNKADSPGAGLTFRYSHTNNINTAFLGSQYADLSIGNVGGIVAYVKDHLRANIEAVSGGRNTVVYDAQGDPHIMVVMPQFLLQDIDASLGTGVHPAFIVGNRTVPEILIGKYMASVVNAHIKTLPRKAPFDNIYMINAVVKARECGAGFSVMTQATYAARMLYLYKEFIAEANDNNGNGHWYDGNTNRGKSAKYPHHTGIRVDGKLPGDTTGYAYTLTGTGPVSWNDDGTEWGVADLQGNGYEVATGYSIINGEINIIPNNDAALATADFSDSSTQWKAILQDGTLVAPGTANTLKWDAPQDASTGNPGAPILNTTITHTITGSASLNSPFSNVTIANGVTCPALLKQLNIYRLANTGCGGNIWIKPSTTRQYATFGTNWMWGMSYLNNTQLLTEYAETCPFRLCYIPQAQELEMRNYVETYRQDADTFVEDRDGALISIMRADDPELFQEYEEQFHFLPLYRTAYKDADGKWQVRVQFTPYTQNQEPQVSMDEFPDNEFVQVSLEDLAKQQKEDELKRQLKFLDEKYLTPRILSEAILNQDTYALAQIAEHKQEAEKLRAELKALQ